MKERQSGDGDGKGFPRVGSCELHPEEVVRRLLCREGPWTEATTGVETARPWTVCTAHHED